MDTVSTAKRSQIMSRVRQKDTTPEILCDQPSPSVRPKISASRKDLCQVARFDSRAARCAVSLSTVAFGITRLLQIIPPQIKA